VLDTAGAAMLEHQDQHDVLRHMRARFAWSCDDPRELERWGLGLALRESSTFFDPPAAMPPAARRMVEAYRLVRFAHEPRSPS
jgi:hypothetical protein